MPRGCYPRKPRFYPIEPDSPIDDVLTQERLGYAATSVSPGSISKKVTFRCARCGRLVDRVRYRVKPGTLCRSCAHSKDGKPIKHPLKSGYEKIEVACAGCGKRIKVRKMSLHAESKCPSCRRKSAVVLNKYVDAEETKRRFGYDGTTVPSKSHDSVVVRCAKCGVLFERIRRDVTKEPVCAGCAGGSKSKFNPHIDDVETKKRFGYVGTLLPYKATPKVVLRCAKCSKLMERKRCAVTDQPRCDTCRYPTEAHPYIDAEKTKEQFGYDPMTLAYQSQKRVVVRCAQCSDSFVRIRMLVTDKPICKTCRCPSEEHPALDDDETFKRFGYRVSEIPRKSTKKVVGRCVKCGAFFERARHNVIATPVCRACSCTMNNTFGSAEQHFGEKLEKYIGRALQTQFRLSSGKYLDFYDEVSCVGVEYNGLFWHSESSPNPRGRMYHMNKYQTCLREGISLINVFEDEWQQRSAVVLDIIATRMGKPLQRIGARKCVLKEVSQRDVISFFNAYHVQGAPRWSWITWGLYEKSGSLIAAMSFGPHHRQGHPDIAVLTRFVCRGGLSVVGGASRLFAAALPGLRARGCKQILSWSDNRWFSGLMYKKLGFMLEEELGPDYMYAQCTTRPPRRLSKQSQRKSVTKCPPGLTEYEWALQRGLVRLWDCGKKRWRLDL